MAQTPLSEIEKYNQMLKDRAASIVSADPPEGLRNLRETVKAPISGEIYTKPTEDVDYGNEQVLGVNTEWPVVKYSGVGNELKSFAEGLAQIPTLGFFEEVRAPFLNSEQKQDILERQKFTGIGKALGEITPFFIPTTGIGKAVGATARLGRAAAEAIGEGSRLRNVAALSTQASIDTGIAAFSAAKAQNALDEYHQENLFAETVKGMVFGAPFGLLGAFIKPKPNLKIGLPEVAAESEVAATKPTVKQFKNIPNMIQDLNSARVKSAEVAENELAFSKFAGEYAELVEHPDGTLIDPQTQPLEIRLKRDAYEQYLASLYNDAKAHNDYFGSGGQKFATDIAEWKKSTEVGRKYGEAGRPIKAAINNIYNPTIRGAQADLISVRKMRGEVESEFKPEVLDTTFPQANQYKLAADSVVGNDSFLTRNLLEMDASLASAKESASGQKYVDSLVPGYLKNIATDLRAAAEESGMVAKGLPSKVLPALGGKVPLVSKATPSQIYKFITKAEDYIGATYDAAEKLKLREAGSYANEAKLYSKLKQELAALKAQFTGFAPKDAELTESIKTMNRAEEALRIVLGAPKRQKQKVVIGGEIAKEQGIERGLIARDSFNKLGAYNPSTGKSSLSEVRPTIEKFFDTLTSEFKKFGELSGRDMSEYIERMNANKLRAIEGMNDRDAISWKSLERWYKWQDNVNGAGKTTGKGLPSNRVRLNRIGHDIATGNISAAQRQAFALVTDNVIGMLTKSKGPGADRIRLQIEAMNRLKQMGDRGEQITESFVSRIAKGTPLKGSASKLVSILPYQMRKLNSDDRNKIDNEFRKVSERLFELSSNPETIYNILQTNRVLNDLSDGAGDALNNKMLGTFSRMYSLMPKGPPEIQGGGPPSLMERAKFLDLVTALTDPYRVVQLMEFGAVTQEMIDAMKETSPEIYNKLTTKVAYTLNNNPKISLKARTKFQSLFPMLNATVRPIPGATPVSAVAPPPQETGDQSNSAMAKVRISGPNKLDANKQVGTFTTQGKP